jgi:predicted nucleic acid-binding Zn ribbon protein
MPQLLARRGYGRVISHDQYAEAWQLACQGVDPELARYSRPGVLRRGVLEVIVVNSLVLQELTFHKQQLLRTLTEQLPSQRIGGLRFTVGKLE